MNLLFTTVGANAITPRKMTKGAAAFDLYSPVNSTIKAGTRKLILTNIAMEIQEGYFGKIHSRSGLSLRNGIEIGAGIIDSDYRGNVGVILYNHSATVDYNVKAGDRIAQIIFYKSVHVELLHRKNLSTKTTRGDGGFGSTDKK